jgi:glutathione S-transferase
MTTRLYVIPGSHAANTAVLMLAYKGIDYKRTDLMPVVSKGALRVVGFPGVTVPALKIEGEKIQGSRPIARALDRHQPEPPLFPADPDRRAAVEEAERFGDEELQHPLRQLLWWAFKRDKENLRGYSEGAHMGVPVGLAIKTGGPLVAAAAHFNEATDANAHAALVALPDLLDRVDAYIADGTIGGAEPNAADFQIAGSVRLLLATEGINRALDGTRVAEHARGLLPDPLPGEPFPWVLPSEWLAGRKHAAP